MKTTLSLMLIASVAMGEVVEPREKTDIEKDSSGIENNDAPANCDHDEVYNQLGPHRCENDNDCTGERYCSGWGWCNGDSWCPEEDDEEDDEANDKAADDQAAPDDQPAEEDEKAAD